MSSIQLAHNLQVVSQFPQVPSHTPRGGGETGKTKIKNWRPHLTPQDARIRAAAQRLLFELAWLEGSQDAPAEVLARGPEAGAASGPPQVSAGRLGAFRFNVGPPKSIGFPFGLHKESTRRKKTLREKKKKNDRHGRKFKQVFV